MEPRVVEFDERYAGDFARLNYAWIERYFVIESHDREILDHPFEAVIKPGGQIFFILVDEKCAGTVAMIPAGVGVFELTKMAVDDDHQGYGLANDLMKACIEFALANEASTIFLESHRSLKAALALYRKFGFVEVPTDPNSEYDRADIRMELALRGANM